jgi:hypothetical protein
MYDLVGVSVTGRAVLKWIIENQRMRVWAGLSWFQMGSHDHGNECLGFKKGKELLHQLNVCQILKKKPLS